MYSINLKKRAANITDEAAHALLQAWQKWLKLSAIARKGGKVPPDLMASRNAVGAATRRAQKAGVSAEEIREIQQFALANRVQP